MDISGAQDGCILPMHLAGMLSQTKVSSTAIDVIGTTAIDVIGMRIVNIQTNICMHLILL